VRFRGVLYGAILLVAAAGCAGQNGETQGSGIQRAATPAGAPPAWTEPAAYKFTFESSCGEQPLHGRFRADVADGTVTSAEGLDDAGRRALMLRIANLLPSLGQMVDEAERAEAKGGTATIERDPTDGHPTAIRIDPIKNAIDDEMCYTISEYTIGGQPGPSASPTR
jgi:hypothetical protein